MLMVGRITGGIATSLLFSVLPVSNWIACRRWVARGRAALAQSLCRVRERERGREREREQREKEGEREREGGSARERERERGVQQTSKPCKFMALDS